MYKMKSVPGLVILTVLLMAVLCPAALAGDSFADLPNRSEIILEATDWMLEQSTLLRAKMECGGNAVSSDSEVDNSIVEMTVKQGSTAKLTARFDCIKSGRYVIRDRAVEGYCELYVPVAMSDPSMVTIEGNQVTFDQAGSVSAIVKYEHADLLGTAVQVPKLMVRYDFTVEESSEEAALKLYTATNNTEISEFGYACGSFVFDDTECSIMNLEYTVPKGDSATKSCILTLPEGFSFQPFAVQRTQPVSCAFGSKNEYKDSIAVHPLYAAEMPSEAVFSMTGDAECMLKIRVEEAPHAGYVDCQNTPKISKDDSANPISVQQHCNFAEAFAADVSSFRMDLNELGCALSFAVYEEEFIRDSFRNLGFTDVQYLDNQASNAVGYALARKKIVTGGKVENVLAVALRGTTGTE